MFRRLFGLAVLAIGCSSEEGELPIKADAPAKAATGGKVEEANAVPQELCVHPDAVAVMPALPTPPIAKDLFRKEDSFGNERWGAAYYLDVSASARQELGGRTISTRAEAGVSATLDGKQQELARIVVDASGRDGEPARVSSDLVFLDKVAYPLFEFTAVFAHGDEFTQQMMEVELPLTIGGEVEVSVELEAWVTLGYQLVGQANAFGLSGKFEPHAAIVASGGISVGDTTEVVEAGLLGSLLLADVRAPLEASLRFDPTLVNPELSWFISAGLDLSWLTGNLKAYARLATERRTQLLAEWPGFTSSHRVAFGSGAVVLDPPTNRCDGTRALDAPPPTPSGASSPQSARGATPSSFLRPTFDDALAALSRNPSPAERGEALSWLKRIFRRGEVSSTRLRGELEGPHGRLLLSALGADGSTSSLDQLLAVLADSTFSDQLRSSAAASLGLSAHITPEALKTLQALPATAPAVQESVTYAIANGADTLSRYNAELADAVVSDLESRAKIARTPRDRLIATRALANLKTPLARQALSGLVDRKLGTSQLPCSAL